MKSLQLERLIWKSCKTFVVWLKETEFWYSRNRL